MKSPDNPKTTTTTTSRKINIPIRVFHPTFILPMNSKITDKLIINVKANITIPIPTFLLSQSLKEYSCLRGKSEDCWYCFYYIFVLIVLFCLVVCFCWLVCVKRSNWCCDEVVLWRRGGCGGGGGGGRKLVRPFGLLLHEHQ